MRSQRILILDCTANKEPREGRIIESLLKICSLYKPAVSTSLRYKIKSKKDFLDKLSTKTRYNIIYISAQGSSEGIGNGSTWEVKIEEIAKVKPPLLKANLVHVSAFVSNYKVMEKAFNSKYFIAPTTDLDWMDAAIFSSLFYKHYIVDGVSLHSAFEYARKEMQTGIEYPIYWGEE